MSRTSRRNIAHPLLVLGLLLAGGALLIGQQQRKPLTLAEVLTGLQTEGRTAETRTLAARNRFIARRVRERGVTFPLNADNESELRNAGASDELIEAIRAASASRPSARPTPTPVPVRNTRPRAFRNRVGMEMALIPAGSFQMGSTNEEAQAAWSRARQEYKDAKIELFLCETPKHEVTIGYSFYMGRTEVTQAQWQAVMGNNPSHFKGDNLPVEQVSWNDAKDFIAKLNELNDGYEYRLPSEAEWEYACRAGTTRDYAGDLDSMAWYRKNSGDTTHAVGMKQANGFGLHDMSGNIGEWCEDVWHDRYNGAPTDGSSWMSGGDARYRVMRGGSWFDSSFRARSAYRSWVVPSARNYVIGFRVVAIARM